MSTVWDNGREDRSLLDDIIQHTIRNDDWTNRELLEHLGLLACSKAILFSFLAAAVHPTAVSDEVQRQRVERINEHLRHDGYRLQRSGRISGSLRSEAHTSELQSLMRISYDVFCLKKKT